MKNLYFVTCLTAVSLVLISDVIGQTPPAAKMSSSTQPSSSLEVERLEPTKQPSSPSTKKESLPTAVTPPRQVNEEAEYLHPGILVNIGGRWEGSDHLLNISTNIGVYVSIVKPENEELPNSDAQIKTEVENIFSLANIKPQILVTSGKPPLPAFEIEIFVYPIDRGYVAYCSGRLFESVVLDRFKMDPNMAFQAITWEKQHLIVTPKEQLGDQITKTVQDIAKTFAERFQVYEKIKKGL